jgi:hypothetical protein
MDMRIAGLQLLDTGRRFASPAFRWAHASRATPGVKFRAVVGLGGEVAIEARVALPLRKGQRY